MTVWHISQGGSQKKASQTCFVEPHTPPETEPEPGGCSRGDGSGHSGGSSGVGRCGLQTLASKRIISFTRTMAPLSAVVAYMPPGGYSGHTGDGGGSDSGSTGVGTEDPICQFYV